jgi:uncharacterized membrane protein
MTATRRPRTVEVFRGPRLRVRVSAFRRVRSLLFLVVVSVILGGLVAAALTIGVGAITQALTHATSGSGGG